MADTKISALTALTGANVEHTADALAIVDDSVTTTKKILVSELAKSLEILSTEQASTSGTSIDFTSIPAWVKRITVQFSGVSTNSSSAPLVQIGDSGGVETTGYLGSGSAFADGSTAFVSNFTTGFGIRSDQASEVLHGAMVLTLEDASNNTWIASGSFSSSARALTLLSSGSKSLSGALDRVRITTVNGTDEFDAGAINILYE